MNLDMTRPDRDLTPGLREATVGEVDARTARSGAAMLNIRFVDPGNGSTIAFDNIMLEGGGWSIGRPKLVALGVPVGFGGEFDPASLRGRRVTLALKIDTYEGKDRLAVDIDQLSSGYGAIEGQGELDVSGDSGDVPF